MASTSDQLWLTAAILAGFPFVFAAVWSFVCAILATASGYRSLAAFRIDRAAADEGEMLPAPWYAMIGWVSYRGRILNLRATPGGLTVRILRVFLFHPPIRVPWARIQETDGRGILGRLGAGSILLDDRVRLVVPEGTFAAIRSARARYGG